MEQYLWLIPVGFVLGAYATLIGTGGGFVLVPGLLLLYPKENPETIASISLAVVFFNALSGSIAYARARRIDYKSGFIFSFGTIPGSVLGALTTPLITRRIFDLIFGTLMILASAFLLLFPQKGKEPRGDDRSYLAGGWGHPLGYNATVVVVLGLLVGYISGLLGIGGGFIEVPAIIYLLKFPVHIATATSQFIQVIMAFAGSATHVVTGAFHRGVRRTIVLSVGVILGAQLGARLSGRIHADWIIRGLAIALGFVGVRLIFMAF
jgi:uncharacterized membrane protein YfcA